MSGRSTPLSDEDEATLRAMSLVERTTVAEQRRRAVRAYARRARRDPNVARLVAIYVEQKRIRDSRANVIPLRRRGT